MTRTLTEDANAIVVQAYERATGLGHPYLGGEHLLLALAAVGVDIDAVLATTEASFGLEALTRAARTVHRRPRWFDPRPAAFAGPDGAYLPLGPGAGQAMQGAIRQAQARGATRPFGVEDLALGIVTVSEGLAPTILSALGVPGPALGTAILDRYHPAS